MPDIPVMTYSLFQIGWSKEKSIGILKRIEETKFSRLGDNYAFVIGVFDGATDFNKIIGAEPILLDSVTPDDPNEQEYNPKI